MTKTDKLMKPRRASPRLLAGGALDSLRDDAEDMVIQRVDETNFAPRPPDAGKTYVEDHFEHRAEEQRRLFAAAGEESAQTHREDASEHGVGAKDESFLIETHAPIVTELWDKVREVLRVLGPFSRSPGAKRLYYATMSFLVLGDIVGIAGAAVILGEIVWMAVIQGIGAGVAAVTSGRLGGEIKDLLQARRSHRDPQTLTEEQQSYAQFFQGPDDREFHTRMMLLGGGSIVVLLMVGVFMLRTSVEGTAAGVTFACLAGAVAIASWVNAYCYSDKRADARDTALADAQKATKAHQVLTQAPARAAEAKHLAAVQSILEQHRHAGEAAAETVTAIGRLPLISSPGVVGHGWAVVPYDTEESEGEQPRLFSLRTPVHSNGKGSVS